MKHLLVKITDALVDKPYILKVRFSDGTKKEIDLEPILHGKLYGPLKDKNLFKRVKVNPEVHTVEWPNGADFDPATLYQWEEVKDDFALMASQWKD